MLRIVKSCFRPRLNFFLFYPSPAETRNRSNATRFILRNQYPAKITPSPTTLWRFSGAYHLDFLATTIRIETFDDMSGRDRGTRGRGERGGYESHGRGGGRGRRDGPGVPRRARRARRRTKQRACGGGGFIRQSSFPCQWIPTRLTLPGRAHNIHVLVGAVPPTLPGEHRRSEDLPLRSIAA